MSGAVLEGSDAVLGGSGAAPERSGECDRGPGTRDRDPSGARSQWPRHPAVHGARSVAPVCNSQQKQNKKTQA